MCDDISAQAYRLVVLDHVDFVNPADYGVTADKINPCDYFVTSGDAVEKAKVMERDMWQLAGKIRKQLLQAIATSKRCSADKAFQLYKSGTVPRRLKKLYNYEIHVWKAAGQARKLVHLLKTVKGDNCFLETEWDEHEILCIQKNPRK